MQISKAKDGLIEIKTKSAIILIDHKIIINDVSLEGAGEYEIGGISIEGIDDNIYICQGEDINFAMVNFIEKISKESIEKLSSVSLLFARVDQNVDAAIEQISQIEPNLCVYIGDEPSYQKIKSASIDVDKTETLKVSKKDLDEAEGSYFLEINDASSK